MTDQLDQDQHPAVFLNALGIICSLGNGVDEVASELFAEKEKPDYMTFTDAYSPEALPLGLVKAPLLKVNVAREDSRNNRMLETAVDPLLLQIEALANKYGRSRIGVVIGTSTSGISDGEDAMAYHHAHGAFPEGYSYTTQEIVAPARYLAKRLNLTGPVFSVSSACTSGSKALASASRLLRLGVCDVVIAGGVDTLCKMTVRGFASLNVVSNEPCLPFSANRKGINIGEGAAVFIVSREEAEVELAGYGESSDAHHISAPDPEGVGAELAMRKALSHSNIKAEDVDYINFHGTATDQNDRMEAIAVNKVISSDVYCSSTKPLVGHTLGAAGAIEAAFCWMALKRKDGKLPVHHWDDQQDPALPEFKNMVTTKSSKKIRVAMSNSFAFGGNNIAVVLRKNEC